MKQSRETISIALVGSGGAGAMTAGSLLLEAAGSAGWYGIMTRSSGPQIRGGEAAALLRLSPFPVDSHGNGFDILLGIDWLNADRFAAEIPLGPDSLVIGDAGSAAPAVFTDSGAGVAQVPFAEIAGAVDGGRPNMVALGILSALIGLPMDRFRQVLERTLKRKGAAAIESSLAAIEAGAAKYGLGESRYRLPPLETDRRGGNPWHISGNEAAGLGAIRGGVRFVAAYPITPATELLEWMTPALEQVGGVLVQAEDELASVNQLIGASFGGTPALTATSGPGLALMTESIGLAVASETPIVVVDVMRGGPSTGIPTKSEQSDLNIALYGLHGDAPHLVLAPVSVADCLFTTQWAVHLAESLQTAAIVLSDQYLGQTRAIVDQPADVAFLTSRAVQKTAVDGYQRYAGGGVSSMALPGTPGCQYTADGLEHSVSGMPSSRAEDHLRQLDKRRDKLLAHDYGDHWAIMEGDGELAVITWGSSLGPVREACAALRHDGIAVRVVAPRLLLPVQPERMRQAMAGVKQALVVEQSHGAQFLHYLQAFYPHLTTLHSMAQPGPLPIRPGAVADRLRQLHQ